MAEITHVLALSHSEIAALSDAALEEKVRDFLGSLGQQPPAEVDAASVAKLVRILRHPDTLPEVE